MDVFQHPIYTVNFSNNILVPQVKVYTKETEHDMSFDSLTVEL